MSGKMYLICCITRSTVVVHTEFCSAVRGIYVFEMSLLRLSIGQQLGVGMYLARIWCAKCAGKFGVINYS